MSTPTAATPPDDLDIVSRKLEIDVPMFLVVTDVSVKTAMKTGEKFYKVTFHTADKKTKVVKELENCMNVGDEIVIAVKNIELK